MKVPFYIKQILLAHKNTKKREKQRVVGKYFEKKGK